MRIDTTELLRVIQFYRRDTCIATPIPRMAMPRGWGRRTATLILRTTTPGRHPYPIPTGASICRRFSVSFNSSRRGATETAGTTPGKTGIVHNKREYQDSHPIRSDKRWRAADVNRAARLGTGRPVSRVLSRAPKRPETAIHLGRASPRASSFQPGSDAGHAMAPLFGIAPGGV